MFRKNHSIKTRLEEGVLEKELMLVPYLDPDSS